MQSKNIRKAIGKDIFVRSFYGFYSRKHNLKKQPEATEMSVHSLTNNVKKRLVTFKHGAPAQVQMVQIVLQKD